MIKALLPWVFLLCLACAGPTFSMRPVHSDPSWLVRLDTYADPGKAAELRHDHPAEWTEAELRAILSRLLLQERVGLLEKKPPPRPVFSSDEVSQLTPRLQQAFRMVRPSEWVSFCATRQTGGGQEVTSGGFFFEERRLHVLVANHREPVSPEGAEAVRANPVSALKGTGNTVTFDPARFVLATQTSWLGGYSGAAASEMILDQTAFLEAARQPAVPLVPALAPAPVPPVQVSPPPVSIVPATPAPAPPAQTSEPDGAGMKAQVLRLQEEVERLKQKLVEQTEEIARLKASRSEPQSSKPKKPAKKPTQ